MRLRNGADHIGVIEEMLWLGRWSDVRHVRKSYRQNLQGGNRDVDFRFKFEDRIIYLEAKYKWRDWMAKVDGPSFSRDFDSYFEDVDRKFIVCPSGEINVVAISTLAQVDHSLEECVWRYLNERAETNAVIVRSYDAPDGRAARVFSLDHALIAELDRMLAIVPEEHFYAYPIGISGETAISVVRCDLRSSNRYFALGY